jgi:hypothetical protein
VRSHQLCLWCGRHRVLEGTGPRRFSQKLDCGDGEEHAREARIEAPLVPR